MINKKNKVQIKKDKMNNHKKDNNKMNKMIKKYQKICQSKINLNQFHQSTVKLLLLLMNKKTKLNNKRIHKSNKIMNDRIKVNS
jgi:hypothetical protein